MACAGGWKDAEGARAGGGCLTEEGELCEDAGVECGRWGCLEVRSWLLLEEEEDVWGEWW